MSLADWLVHHDDYNHFTEMNVPIMRNPLDLLIYQEIVIHLRLTS